MSLSTTPPPSSLEEQEVVHNNSPTEQDPNSRGFGKTGNSCRHHTVNYNKRKVVTKTLKKRKTVLTGENGNMHDKSA